MQAALSIRTTPLGIRPQAVSAHLPVAPHLPRCRPFAPPRLPLPPSLPLSPSGPPGAPHPRRSCHQPLAHAESASAAQEPGSQEQVLDEFLTWAVKNGQCEAHGTLGVLKLVGMATLAP